MLARSVLRALKRKTGQSSGLRYLSTTNSWTTPNKPWAFRLASVGLVSLALYAQFRQLRAEAASHQQDKKSTEYLKGKLPSYTRKEVAQHNSPETGIWVIFGGGVYDVTTFVPQHPGGSKILLAAGASIEPFWKVYTIHQNPEVKKILEQYRIGDLDPSDSGGEKSAIDVNDPFANDPVRNPALLVRSQSPFNAETPDSILADQFITPNEFFYVRNHLPVPDIKPEDYELKVTIGEKTITYRLEDLKAKFTEHKIMASLQCAGNRRRDMNAAGPLQGLSWEKGAISNAVWTGVLLYDVLRASGVDLEKLRDSELHVRFDGADGYGASVPIDKVADPRGDVLLAYEMNGEPVPRDHGSPVRVLIPGHAAARSVKWVDRISISNEESESHWQRNDYKGFNPSTDWDNMKWEKSSSIQEMPVQSAFLEPANESKIPADADEIELKGYAWSGGGRGIIRVDVSLDGGKSWKEAEIFQRSDQPRNRVWAWSQWRLVLPLEEDQREFNLVCKAIDSSYNVQPDSFDGIYNRRGVLSTAWHRITVRREEETG